MAPWTYVHPYNLRLFLYKIRGDNIKTVAVLLRRAKTEDDEPKRYQIRKDVIDILKMYNINYFLIPMDTEDNNDYDNVIKMINLADGVLIPGGKKGGEIELEIIKYLHDNDIPTLGICFGMQNMCVVLNGKRKKTQGHMKPDLKYVHEIIIDKESLLYQIINKEKILVNSRHKNVVDFTDMNISAVSSDGFIEAAEDKTKRCFIGVQWHPETIDDENTKKIFDYFISKL